MRHGEMATPIPLEEGRCVILTAQDVANMIARGIAGWAQVNAGLLGVFTGGGGGGGRVVCFCAGPTGSGPGGDSRRWGTGTSGGLGGNLRGYGLSKESRVRQNDRIAGVKDEYKRSGGRNPGSVFPGAY